MIEQIIGIVLLIIVLVILGFDASCRVFLKKVDPEYKFTMRSSIPGYNIYSYYKFKKELENENT